MSTPEDPHPWTRRTGESSPAYDAFRVYLFQGKDRSIKKAADEAGRSESLFKRWYNQHGWVGRAAAYDSYKVTARVDGEVDELTAVRSKHLEVASKLLDHLAMNMAAWKPGYDPSLRWTTAFTAAAKVQQTALTLRETTTRTDEEAIEKIMAVMEKRAEG